MIALTDALAATQTALLAEQFSGGFIRIFSGVRPDAPNMAETGTLIGVVSINGQTGAGLRFLSSGPVLHKPDDALWIFLSLVTATATWFRLVQPGDTGADDLDALRMDGDIGVTDGAPGDMNWLTTAVTLGHPYTLDQFFYLIQPIGH